MDHVYLQSDNIPEEMHDTAQWCAWKVGKSKPGGKFEKIPVNVHTGENLKGTHGTVELLRQLGTFEEAVQAVERFGLAGVGFILTKDDPYIALDLDEIFSRQIDSTEIIEKFDSYTEVSPSGDGLRIICRGKKPEGKCVHSYLEVFSHSRFVTLTGNCYQCWRDIKDAQKALDSIHLVEGKAPARTGQDHPSRLKEARDALSYIPKEAAEDYNTWIEVGMALHSTRLGEEAFQVWDEWSQKADNYGQTREKWNTFSFRGDGKTISSLFYLAKQYGYQTSVPAPESSSKSLKPEVLPGESESYLELTIIRGMPKYLNHVISRQKENTGMSQQMFINAAVENGLRWLHQQIPVFGTLKECKKQIYDLSERPEIDMKIFSYSISLNNKGTSPISKNVRMSGTVKSRVQELAQLLDCQQGKICCLAIMADLLHHPEQLPRSLHSTMFEDLKRFKADIQELADYAEQMKRRIASECHQGGELATEKPGIWDL